MVYIEDNHTKYAYIVYIRRYTDTRRRVTRGVWGLQFPV